MTASYPLGLSTVLASKSRSQPAAFALSEPRRGAAYVKETGTDVPVFWDVAFIFNQADAIRFQLWFKNTIRRGVDPFLLILKTEFGHIEHECRFLPDSLLPAEQKGPLWSYKATIFARAQLVPDGYDQAADIIITHPDWEDLASWLDLSIVARWAAQT